VSPTLTPIDFRARKGIIKMSRTGSPVAHCRYNAAAAAVLSRLEPPPNTTRLFQSQWAAVCAGITQNWTMWCFCPIFQREIFSTKWVSHYFGRHTGIVSCIISFIDLLWWQNVTALPARCSTWDIYVRERLVVVSFDCARKRCNTLCLAAQKGGASGGHLWGLLSSSGFLLWQPAPAVPMPVSIISKNVYTPLLSDSIYIYSYPEWIICE